MTRKPAKLSPAATGHRTLDELDPLSANERARHPPTKAVAAARAIRLKDLSPPALLTLLHDGRGLSYTLPFAVQAAVTTPWADRGFHRGDLLLAILRTKTTLRPKGTRLHESLVALARKALAGSRRMPPDQRAPDIEAEVSVWLAQNEHWPDDAST